MLMLLGYSGPGRVLDVVHAISIASPSPRQAFGCAPPAAAAPFEAVSLPDSMLRSASMGTWLYVGNLTYDVGDGELQRLFEAFGTVQSAQVIMDRDTGRSKGFGFVEMGSDQEAQAAITGLNGKDVGG